MFNKVMLSLVVEARACNQVIAGSSPGFDNEISIISEAH